MSAGAALLGLALLAPASDGPQRLHAAFVDAQDGALNNDCFLPADGSLSRALREADGLLADSRDPARGDAGLLRAQAFEAWHRALTESAPGDSVEGPGAEDEGEEFDADPEPVRSTEGVEVAVRRRLVGLQPAERRAWEERFEPPAAEALAAAGVDRDRLARLERELPGTPGALRAALRLSDLALERGRTAAARAYLERARQHLFTDRAGAEAERDACARRQALLDSLLPTAAAEAWQAAEALELTGTVVLEDPGSTRRPEGPGVGVRPGLVFLEDGRAVVQTGRRLHLLDLDAARVGAIFTPAKLLGSLGDRLEIPASHRQPPPWSLRPASDGRRVAAVLGRLSRDGSEPNALIVLSPPSTHGPDALGADPLPSLVWGLVGSERVRDGRREVLSELAELGTIEWQPGPVLAGTRLFASARTYEGEATAWLVAFELHTGAVVWKRLLAKGADLGRAGGPGLAWPPGAGEPLTLVDGGRGADRLFVGTHLGAGLLLDALDGRLVYAFKNRRREATAEGWTGEGARPGADGRSLLWAPADGDHLYRLRSDPDLDNKGPLLGPAWPIGEALALVGGDAHRALVLSRAGARRTLSEWDLESGARLDAVHLGPEEGLVGRALASGERALFASEAGLYLCDRGRELFLLDQTPLALAPGTRSPTAADLYARGERVVLLGGQRAWIFESR